MKRKVNRVGANTLTVSLPSKWAMKYGIKAGDEIEVNEEGKKLEIYTQKGITKKQISIDVSGLLPRLVDRFMARSYQKGYDEIFVKFSSLEEIRAIEGKVQELLGFEIMDRKSNNCKIIMIASKLDINFDIALRKAFLIVLEMALGCIEGYNMNEKEVLNSLYQRDLEVNKYCYFCLREINKQFTAGFGSYILYYLVENLEDAGDELKALGINLTKIKSKQRDISDILVELHKMIQLAYDFFYKPNINVANQSLLLFGRINQKIENMQRKNEKLMSILMNIHRINNIMYHFPTMRLDTLKELN